MYFIRTHTCVVIVELAIICVQVRWHTTSPKLHLVLAGAQAPLMYRLPAMGSRHELPSAIFTN